MINRPFTLKLPEIAESEQTPVVRGLLQVIGDQQAHIQRLEDELRRLQGGPPRPQLKPNTLQTAVEAALKMNRVAGVHNGPRPPSWSSMRPVGSNWTGSRRARSSRAIGRSWCKTW